MWYLHAVEASTPASSVRHECHVRVLLPERLQLPAMHYASPPNLRMFSSFPPQLPSTAEPCRAVERGMRARWWMACSCRMCPVKAGS